MGTLNLYVLRHGKACARGPKWNPDSARPLSSDGEKRVFEAARGMETLDLGLDLILTSPFIRAFRTAEIVAEVLGLPKVVETRNLTPEASFKSIVAEIKEDFSSHKGIMLVGHEPFLSGLISTLLTGGDSLPVNFRKGALCALAVNKLALGPCATLEWLLTSRQMARMKAK